MEINYDVNDYSVTLTEDILEKHYVNNHTFEGDQFYKDVINEMDPNEFISFEDFDEYYPKELYVEEDDRWSYLALEWSKKDNKWLLGYKYPDSNKWNINIFVDNISNLRNALLDLLNLISIYD